ncbi:uncharacterized protein RHIMIDRAFT_234322 [Rhizopus microsporus ATCC 52813]|uniref:MYND-type domain-containing protein n=1 Tax=Rhizopus microsporus ATCC 52813 TaxID=1340429 RepID=A0A2G4T6U9_RHIZD|nr:uncharacterized protein RHIMIDRAFT_234322 [Rhizopus microsporus ATCC 52813]PHZ16728.1 hypothetical protein RHIMIDRAFT_234322 [Rhizopus microsporus ATCC 52813]
MREPNFSFPSQSRAAVCITSALYDRRALDCTATLPLVNSLTHLAYLTSTSPRIREILCLDGGLERLVRILFNTSNRADRLTSWKWTLAFQTVVNVGVRGTEQIRTKVVDAGMIPFILTILSNTNKGLEQRIDNNNNSSNNNDNINSNIINNNTATVTDHSKTSSIHNNTLRRSTFPYVKINAAQRRHRRIHKDDKKHIEDHVFHREEDILLSLQLLAYLSKYPHIRDLFHTAYDKNVFSAVEKFCHRTQPGPVQYWAGVIMRNACRKDETRGGLRRCANMHCGKWETQPREFAKCRRCRKAKYCSKPCQSKAWADGHRWWCVERHPPVPVNGAAGAATTSATTTTNSVSTTTVANTSAIANNVTANANNGSNTDLNLSSHNNNSSHSSSITFEQTSESNTETTDNRSILMEMGVRMEL